MVWMSGRADEAEEAFSRAGMLALEKYPQHREDLQDPKAWLTRLTYNVCMDLHRERGRERARQLSDAELLGRTASPPWSVDFISPERIFLRRELTDLIENSVRCLPLRLREVMEPLIFDDVDYSELAHRLGLSEVALRKRVQQARTILRRQLAAYAHGRTPKGVAEKEEKPVLALSKARASRSDPWSRPCPRALEVVSALSPSGLERELELWLPEPSRPPSGRRLASLERYVERHPTGWKKRLELARQLGRGGRFGEAVEHYGQVTERQPRRPGPWLEQAFLLTALGRREEAREVHARAQAAAARVATRHHLAGAIAGFEGRLGDAAEALGEAARLEPSNPVHPLVLGAIYLEAGWVTEAVEILTSARSRARTNPVVLLLCHDALRRAGRLLEATRCLEEAVAEEGAGAPVLARLLDLRSRARKVEGEEGEITRELLRQLVRRDPHLATTHRGRARLQLARGAWEAAEGELASFLEEHPNHAAAWHFHGRILEQVGKLGAAATALHQAFDLDPQDPAVRRSLIRLLPRAGSVEAARELARETLEASPHHPEILCLVARELARFPDERPLVRELLHRSATLQPRLPKVALARGQVHLAWGEPREAATAFEEAWELLPDDDAFGLATEAALALGECWERLGEVERGRSWYRSALERSESLRAEDPPAAEAARGQTLAALGRRDEARQALRQALGHHLLFPHRAQVASRLRRLDEEARRG